MRPVDRTGNLTSPAAVEVASASIFAVVVLYKMLPDELATIRTLLEAARAVAEAPVRLSISIFDNTPGGQGTVTLPEGVRYQAVMGNPGLAVPYNRATAAASREGY